MSRMRSGAGADDPATEVLSATAILSREGLAPEAADRSARAQHRRDAEPEGEPDKRGVVRNGAIAGGAVLAAGAAVGVALLADSEPPAGGLTLVTGDGGEGPYPGQGLLDPEVSAEAPLEPVVIDPAASTGTLDDAATVVPLGIPASEVAALFAAPEPSSHDADPGGPGGTRGEDDTAFGSGSGSSGGSSGAEASGDDAKDADAKDADEGGFLGIGDDEGVLDSGLMPSDSSHDQRESFGDGDGGDDGGGGLLDTGLLG
jgi:hypothetical protein